MRDAQPSTVVGREPLMTKPMLPGRGHRRTLRVLACAVLLAAAAGGCSRSRAAEVIAGPPLAVPAPPPRVIAAAEKEPLVASSGRADTPLAPAPEVVQDRATVPASPPPAQPPREEPPAASTTSSSPSDPPTLEFPQVRAGSAVDDAARRKVVENLLASAQRDLNRISQQSLNAQGREQLKDAMSLLDAARRAMNERDFNFAEIQAGKAATLAASLAARR